jgi:hypothetical protein
MFKGNYAAKTILSSLMLIPAEALMVISGNSGVGY